LGTVQGLPGRLVRRNLAVVRENPTFPLPGPRRARKFTRAERLTSAGVRPQSRTDYKPGPSGMVSPISEGRDQVFKVKCPSSIKTGGRGGKKVRFYIENRPSVPTTWTEGVLEKPEGEKRAKPLHQVRGGP